MSSPSIEVIETLQRQDPTYVPNAEVSADLQKKDLGMIVGPVFAGKSTVISAVCKLDTEFAAASSFTTRPRRDNDSEGEYVFYPHTREGIAAVYDLQQQGKLAQYVAYPGLEYLYGSVPEDYPGRYNLRPVMASAIAGMLRAPFAQHHVLGISCPPTEWDKRDAASVSTRGKDALAQRPARIKEGVKGMEQLLRSDTSWIHNPHGGLQEAARTIIRTVKHQEEAPMGNRREAEKLYRHLSRIATEL